MKITLRRVYDTPDHTIGILQIGTHASMTIEDAFHAPKIQGKTRIPSGSYDVGLRQDSPMARRYADKFGDGHKGMIWVKNVPDFTYVYLHIGNESRDTEGCVLVGRTADIKKGFIGGSADAYKELYPLIMYAHKQGEQITITITDQFS